MPFLGVGGVLCPKLAIETPTTCQNLGKLARDLQKGWSKFDQCGTRCEGQSESVGRVDFLRWLPLFASKHG